MYVSEAHSVDAVDLRPHSTLRLGSVWCEEDYMYVGDVHCIDVVHLWPPLVRTHWVIGDSQEFGRHASASACR
jgi:hypothetical protein